MPVATSGAPKRVPSYVARRFGGQGEIQFCVLDEADLMLQMGFQEAVEDIFKEMPENKQTTLWSATMPGALRPNRSFF